MRSRTLAMCAFGNLLVLGMCGYLYLLWSNYTRSQYLALSQRTAHDRDVYYYNRGYPNETHGGANRTHKRTARQVSSKHHHNDTVLVITDSKPRFVNLQTAVLQPDSDAYHCMRRDAPNCTEKTSAFRHKVVMELQRIFMKESDIFKSGEKVNNPYNVHYTGPKENYAKKSARELVCEMKNTIHIRTVTRRSAPPGLRPFVPRREMFHNRHFNSCAIIASAGSLRGSHLGPTIDQHEVVLRFNHAPTKDYEPDVGSRTTMRILNSQVVTKAEYAFLTADLYRNISILVWDPSNYTATLQDWYTHPDYDLFPNYRQFRHDHPRTKLHLLDPQSLWSIWDFLQRNSPNRLRRNPPSSGFLALAHLLGHCSYVDMFEYMPSTRITRRCHYFDDDDNPSCTFGVWHPLAAEKLIAYAMNTADDYHVFQTGFMRIPGFRTVEC